MPDRTKNSIPPTRGTQSKFIRSVRGKYKDLPLMETLKASKREEKKIKIHSPK